MLPAEGKSATGILPVGCGIQQAGCLLHFVRSSIMRSVLYKMGPTSSNSWLRATEVSV
jgi:hypothetical protein